MAGRQRRSPAPSKALPPLRLGAAGARDPELTAEVLERRPLPTVALIRCRGDSVAVTPRAAEALSDWLHVFARPKPTAPTLWGIGGIAEECKVSRRTVYTWIDKPTFPEPVPVVGGNGPVWEARAVKAWVRLARRKGGRPRKEGDRR